jgi:hypothetical protein
MYDETALGRRQFIIYLIFAFWCSILLKACVSMPLPRPVLLAPTLILGLLVLGLVITSVRRRLADTNRISVCWTVSAFLPVVALVIWIICLFAPRNKSAQWQRESPIKNIPVVKHPFAKHENPAARAFTKYLSIAILSVLVVGLLIGIGRNLYEMSHASESVGPNLEQESGENNGRGLESKHETNHSMTLDEIIGYIPAADSKQPVAESRSTQNGTKRFKFEDATLEESIGVAMVTHDPDMEYIVGFEYFKGKTPNGDVFLRDNDKAIFWLEKAASKGHIEAEVLLAELYALKTDFSKALPLIVNAAGKGNAEAETLMGWMYQNGEGGLTRDQVLARTWYEKSAKGGCADGQFRYGVMLIKGIGGTPDPTNGVEWLRRAARQDDASAKSILQQAHVQW